MKSFYKVEYNGNLLKYYKVGHDCNNIPIWTSKSMMDCTVFEKWKIKNVDFNTYFGTSSFSEKYAKNISGFYPINKYKEARKCSKLLWNKIISPRGKYNVVRYFDDHFDKFMITNVSKIVAYRILESMNKIPSTFYSYNVTKYNYEREN